MSTLDRYANYIDGAWVGADSYLAVDDPATGEVYAEIAVAGISDACLLYTSPSPRD